MKTLLLAALLVAAPAALAQTRATDLALRTELLDRYAADQEIRQRLIAAGLERPDSLLLAEMTATDADNTARIAALVAQHGWLTPELVGDDGANAAFLFVQHAEPGVQRQMLPLAEAAYRAGSLPGQSYALLLDRVRIGQGERQIYGTQIVPPTDWVDGQPAAYPTDDDAGLDARRAEVGLPPLAEYLALIREVYAPASK